jgi:hypothetical protein
MRGLFTSKGRPIHAGPRGGILGTVVQLATRSQKTPGSPVRTRRRVRRVLACTMVTVSALTAAASASAESLTPGLPPSQLLIQTAPMPPSGDPLLPFFNDSGLISLSVDALGTNDPAGGPLMVHKNAAGATVRKAYLFAASTGFSGYTPVNGDVTLDGSPVEWDPAHTISNDISSVNVEADVTSLVKAKVDAAPAGDVSFTAAEPNNPLLIDGEILAVTLSDPTVTESQSVTLLYGAQQPTGDSFHVALAEPVKKGPNFELNLSLGISFGFQPSGQFSTVDVNGTRMTTSAGGQDDGEAANGALITAGGIGDSNDNPPEPFATDFTCQNAAGERAPRCDDELYSLVPFLNEGDEGVEFTTTNPSNDDNIFFAALYGAAGVVGEGITLKPLEATNKVGQPHTLTATVQDENGKRIAGKTVTFEVISGPNKGTKGTAVSDVNGEAEFTYTSSTEGTDHIVARFTNAKAETQTSNEATKTWEASVTDPEITASGTTVSATEGANFTGTVATFKDPDTSASASEYTATIEWGDSASSTGTVSGSGGSFAVSGEHTYAEEGSYAVKVVITDTDNASNEATANSTAKVADAALSASGVSTTSPQAFSGTVAKFTDANTSSTTADFTATIDWGDGSPTSKGTVSGSGGSYSVSGSHSYTSTGEFTVKVHIVDDGGSTADATSKILIYGTSKGGNFVIGDKKAAIGTAVTFWGAEWWKLNPMSGGTVQISSFKGFEDNPAKASCGTTWKSDAGNSTPPPAGPLPAYMVVVVSSSIAPNGTRVTGNTAHVVVVKTNPGYAPDPSHPGRGTVVAQIC